MAALGYFAAEAVAAASVPDYSYATDYISALGVPAPVAARKPDEHCVRRAGGALSGRCRVGSRWDRGAKTLPFLSLALLNGIGNGLIAFVHSGAGSALHAVGAAMAIAGGNAAILAAVPVLRRTGASPVFAVSMMLGALGLLSAAAVAFAAAPIGVWERVSVYSILGWQTVCALHLVRRPAVAGSRCRPRRVCSADGER